MQAENALFAGIKKLGEINSYGKKEWTWNTFFNFFKELCI